MFPVIFKNYGQYLLHQLDSTRPTSVKEAVKLELLKAQVKEQERSDATK